MLYIQYSSIKYRDSVLYAFHLCCSVLFFSFIFFYHRFWCGSTLFTFADILFWQRFSFIFPLFSFRFAEMRFTLFCFSIRCFTHYIYLCSIYQVCLRKWPRHFCKSMGLEIHIFAVLYETARWQFKGWGLSRSLCCGCDQLRRVSSSSLRNWCKPLVWLWSHRPKYNRTSEG